MKKLSLAGLVLVGMAVLVAGCATGRQAPDWVTGNSARYKPAQYLIGRGQGDSPDIAADRARADLAKIFQVSISVASEDVSTYSSDTSGDKTVASGTAKVSRTIETQTDQIIQGVQIVENWEDPKTQVYYALAVLPRLQAATSLRQQVEALDDATQKYIDQAQATPDLFVKIADASRALDAQIARSAYQQSLKVVDPTGVGVEPRWNPDTLRADLDGLLRRVHIAPEVGNDPLGGLRAALAGGVSAAGFMVDTGAKPDYTLKASLDVMDVGQREGWDWVRGVLQIQLVEQASGRVLGVHRWELKAAALDPGTARQRLMDQVNDLLKTKLRQTVIAFATR